MTTDFDLQRSDLSRVWMIPFSAGPGNAPVYEGLARAGDAEVQLGDVTAIFVPDPNEYGKFIVAGRIKGDRTLPTMGIMWRYELNQASVLERYVRNGCNHDIQIHMGECQDPQDFNLGWTRVLVLETATPTNFSLPNLGALQPDERQINNEEVNWTAQELYHIYRMVFAEEAASLIVQEVIAVDICDRVTCGECGIPSNGCDIVFALTLTAGGSPGLPAELIFTQNGGDSYSETNVSTLAANEDPDDMDCVGINLVVISEDSESLHYAPIADILAGTETWIEVLTGFVLTNGPLAIHSETARHTWIVGENGYIYFTGDPTGGVVVQDAGVATTQNLNAVHAFDTQNVVAVGDSNALVLTRNGGTTWTSILGPNPGVALNTVFMKSRDIWFVGDAGGQLWYTLDGGGSWTEKAFPGSGTGVVRDIKFINETVGYLSHDTATPAGRILRTIDGGNQWYVMPEGNTSLPANDRINSIGVCPADVNILWAGGLGDNATDGILVKGAGPSLE